MTTDNRHKPFDIKTDLMSVAEVLRSGGVVAMPTDTVYGLVAVAADRAAVERVYETKARDPQQPMPVFVGSAEQAALVAEMNEAAERLAERFWPGALTIVLRKRASFQTRAAAGGDSIAVRVPGDPLLRELALELGPLTGTSANIAGWEECHSAAEVRSQLGDQVDLIVDGPVQASGTPSTIVDATNPGRLRILREGGITGGDVADAIAGVTELT